MLCKDVIKIIEKNYPPRCALSWDNVGLLAGRDDKEVSKIYVALDATDEVVDQAIAAGADMLVTHHPLIFSGMKRVNNQNFIGRRLIKLIQHDISYYAMHTNYDVKGMADLAADYLKLENCQVLDVTGENESGEPEGIGRVGEIPLLTHEEEESENSAETKSSVSYKKEQENGILLADYCEEVKKAFGLSTVKVFGDLNQNIHRVAICPGSGKSDIDQAIAAGADVYVTGDIGHHEGIDAVARGLNIIDAGHYGVEHIFIGDMGKYLRENVSGVEVVEAPVIHPFEVI